VLDHLAFGVSDYQRSRYFYDRALAPLGIVLVHEHEGTWAAFAEKGGTWFIIDGDREPLRAQLHVAFGAADRPAVDAFHAAALAAGGTDNGPPGLRDYHPSYYAAFVLDPDGHNIEAVCHEAS
jgi:catechol 2,3-dioxygenase-like lactoylglutathione lyase family enzyme